MSDVQKQAEEMEILDPTPKVITIGDRQFELKPLVLKQYKKLFTIIGAYMQHLKGLVEFGGAEELTQVLEEIRENPVSLTKYMDTILLFAYDGIVEILAAILDVEKEFIEENTTLDQLAVLAFTVYQQNDVDKIIQSFSQLGRLAQAKGHLPSNPVGDASTQN